MEEIVNLPDGVACATPHHRIKTVNRGWVYAKDITEEDILVTEDTVKDAGYQK